MKIAAAQIAPRENNISYNLALHFRVIEKAHQLGATLVLFPELSLTGYFPASITRKVTENVQSCFEILQQKANQLQINFVIGAPAAGHARPRIAQILFAHDSDRIVFEKLLLHEDETPYFEPGRDKPSLEIRGYRFYIGICYEAFQDDIIQKASLLKPDVYIAAVSKRKLGINDWLQKMREISLKMEKKAIFLNNCGTTETFEAGGRTSFFSSNIKKEVCSLSTKEEEIMLIDLREQTCKPYRLS